MFVKDIIIKILGPVLCVLDKMLISYKTLKIKELTGGVIASPSIIAGAENIIMENNVSIGPGATIYTTGAKIYIKSHVISGPNLTMISGDHKYVAGRYIDSIKGSEKEKRYDQDIIIDKDVWIGANVTILKGVTVGESSIIAAGSLVVKNVPPYTIVGGVPAKVLKRKFSKEDEEKHREFLHLN